MASNTRKSTREAIVYRQKLLNNYILRLEMLFDNCVVCENLPKDLPKRYLLKILREDGGIAYDKKTQVYLRFVPMGIDAYGLPKKYTLFGYNGIMFTRKADDVVILRASDNQYAIQDYFRIQAEKLVDLDLAISQNLEAVKTMSMIEFDDEKSLLSLVNLANARRVGATVAYVNKKSLNSESNYRQKVFSTNCQYLGNDLLEARRKVLNETLSSIGINVANVDKKERVQGEEIRASQGYGIDSLKVLCDTFNYDASLTDDVPIRLKGNTSLYEQYILDTEKTKKEINEGGKENE